MFKRIVEFFLGKPVAYHDESLKTAPSTWEITDAISASIAEDLPVKKPRAEKKSTAKKAADKKAATPKAAKLKAKKQGS